MTDSAKTSGCAYLYSCEECRKQINLWKSRRKRQRPNKCWAYFWKTFKDCVDIDIHKCFMKPVGGEESSSDVGLPIKRPCRSRAPRRASHGVRFLDRKVSSDNYSEEENWEEVNGAKLPPYFVYVYYECTKKEQEHVSILICAIWEDHISSLTPLHFYGPDCTEAFYDWLLTRTRYWTTRSIWLSSSISSKAAMVCLSIGCTRSDLRRIQDFEFEVKLSEFHSFHLVLPLWW